MMINNKFQSTFIGVITNDRATNDSYVVDYSKSIDVRIKIALKMYKPKGKYVGYIMDNALNNPYKIWKEGGSPDFPTFDLRRRMRKVEVRIEVINLND